MLFSTLEQTKTDDHATRRVSSCRGRAVQGNKEWSSSLSGESCSLLGTWALFSSAFSIAALPVMLIFIVRTACLSQRSLRTGALFGVGHQR